MPTARPSAHHPVAAPALALALAATWAHAQSPLPSAALHGTVSVVTPEPSPVVTVRAGSFFMGADATVIDQGRTLCVRSVERFAAVRGGIVADPGVAYGFGVMLVGCGVDEYRSPLCGPNYFDQEARAHEVWLPTFGLDRTEVTVAAYDRCVRRGRCTPPLDPPGTPQTGTPTLPVTGVSWDDAVAYCGWVGGRLPTEAEWERAARGRDGRVFPWGWVFDPGRVNVGAVDPSCHDDTDGFARVAPVGSFPDGASPEGALDLAGNALEWTADRAVIDDDGYPVGYERERAVAPRGASIGSERVVRGGAFDLPPFLARSTARMRRLPGVRARDLGFRCAYDRR